jgi:hypothetical protein
MPVSFQYLAAVGIQPKWLIVLEMKWKVTSMNCEKSTPKLHFAAFFLDKIDIFGNPCHHVLNKCGLFVLFHSGV